MNTNVLLFVLMGLVVVAIVVQIIALLRKVAVDLEPLKHSFDSVDKNYERLEMSVRTQLAESRADLSRELKQSRDELARSVADFAKTLKEQLESFRMENAQSRERIALETKASREEVLKSVSEFGESFRGRLELFAKDTEARMQQSRDATATRLEEQKTIIDDRMRTFLESSAIAVKSVQDVVSTSLDKVTGTVFEQMSKMAGAQQEQLKSFEEKLTRLRESNEKKIDELRTTVEERLKEIQTGNEAKLEAMRVTVDEKLQGTLEKRLGESFKLVSDRLELVHKGLGEMQNLATGVGDLKKVLTNVKVRGTWGEAQLSNLLEQFFSPEQYEKNVAVRRGSQDRVEFAIRLPGKDGDSDKPVYLPIDSKFPQEDYLALQQAQEQGNPELVEQSSRALEARIRSEARDIRDKYLNPPVTTDFAVMFLPTESLFAEVLRRPGAVESITREYRIIVTGPTTCSALLSSLQVGFRTLAVEKRSAEIWKLLGAVKSEFGKFGDLLDKTHKKMEETCHVIDDAAKKSRSIERKLSKVQELPAQESVKLLEAEETATAEGEVS